MLMVNESPLNILSSNVATVEASIDVYSAATTYQIDTETQYNNIIYVCVKANTTGITPGTDDTVWFQRRKTNYYRMFDYNNSTGTSNTDTIEYTFTVSNMDTVGFFGLEARSVTVELLDSSDVVIQTYVKSTFKADVNNWYDWTYEVGDYIPTAIFTDIPPVYDSKLRITIENIGLAATCHYLVFGRAKSLGLGLIKPAPTVSARNKITTANDTTTAYMQYKRISMNVLANTANVGSILTTLEKTNGESKLFIADEREDGMEFLSVFGRYKDFDIPIGREKSNYKLIIEGVK